MRRFCIGLALMMLLCSCSFADDQAEQGLSEASAAQSTVATPTTETDRVSEYTMTIVSDDLLGVSIEWPTDVRLDQFGEVIEIVHQNLQPGEGVQVLIWSQYELSLDFYDLTFSNEGPELSEENRWAGEAIQLDPSSALLLTIPAWTTLPTVKIALSRNSYRLERFITTDAAGEFQLSTHWNGDSSGETDYNILTSSYGIRVFNGERTGEITLSELGINVLNTVNYHELIEGSSATLILHNSSGSFSDEIHIVEIDMEQLVATMHLDEIATSQILGMERHEDYIFIGFVNANENYSRVQYHIMRYPMNSPTEASEIAVWYDDLDLYKIHELTPSGNDVVHLTAVGIYGEAVELIVDFTTGTIDTTAEVVEDGFLLQHPIIYTNYWTDSAGMGSGHGRRYAFLDDGHFVYHAAEGRAERLIAMAGNWYFEDDAIHLTIKIKAEIIGGEVSGSVLSYFIEGGELVETYLEPYEEITFSVGLLYWGQSIRGLNLGDEQFWTGGAHSGYFDAMEPYYEAVKELAQ